MSDERRRALRFPFRAEAEVAPENSPKATITARVTEIGMFGCYMETPAPFEPQTHVLVRIFVPGAFFEAKATIIHVKEASGMGLQFREMRPDFRVILRAWLLDAMRHEDPQSGWQ